MYLYITDCVCTKTITLYHYKADCSVGDKELVEFDVVIGEKDNEASNVTGPNGIQSKGLLISITNPVEAYGKKYRSLW